MLARTRFVDVLGTLKQPKCFKSSPTPALSARVASEMAEREMGPLQEAPTANASYPGGTAQENTSAPCLKCPWKCTSVSGWVPVTYGITNGRTHTECSLSTTKGLKRIKGYSQQQCTIPHSATTDSANSTARPFPHPAAAWNLKICPAKQSPTHKPT